MSCILHGRRTLSDLDASGRIEWRVTNGIGGYASGALAGTLGHRGHGLLIASEPGPADRTLLLSRLGEHLELDGRVYDLSTARWASGAVAPDGHIDLESFRLEDTVPTWTWAIQDVRLEKRVWMEQGENTTYVQYRLIAPRGPTRLTLEALVNHRAAADIGNGGAPFRVESSGGAIRVIARDGATPLWLMAPGARLAPAPVWHRGHALDLEPGVSEDHFMACEITAVLEPGDFLTFVASTRGDLAEAASPLALASALTRRRAHERALLDAWSRPSPATARRAPEWIGQLALSADALLEQHGRESMAALPGLTLSTGRPEIARALMRRWSSNADQGMLPSGFGARGVPEYHAADVSLWFFLAAGELWEETGDDAFLSEIYPVLEDVGAWYERGTRHGIGVDPADGLLRVGEAPRGASDDDGAFTPRTGKPVELNALWYQALVLMSRFAHTLGSAENGYRAMAEQVRMSFGRFWNPSTGCLFDVLDGPDGNDPRIRPNQLLAISMTESPLGGTERLAVLDVCGRRLVTSYGVRSLPPGDPEYRGRGSGPGEAHRGAAWVWLLPHYAMATARARGDRAAGLALLAPLEELVRNSGSGGLPARVAGDPPHTPHPTLAHPLAVAETLRAYRLLAGEARKRRAARARAARVMA